MNRIVRITGLLLSLLLFTRCAAPAPSTPTPTEEADEPFHVHIEPSEGQFATEILSPRFVLNTDNCGSDAPTTETVTYSRMIAADVELDITSDVRAAAGGGLPGVLEGSLEAGLEEHFGVRLGIEVLQMAERDFTTPANRIQQHTFQLQELWTPGTIHLLAPSGELLGEVPFRIFILPHIAQVSVVSESCPPSEVEALAEALPPALVHGLPAALDCLSAHLLDPTEAALCPQHWIATGANQDRLAAYILDQLITPYFTSLDSAEWVIQDLRGLEQDPAWSTPQAGVYTLRLEAGLRLTGELRCASGEAGVVGTHFIPLGGPLRVEIRHPETAGEALYIYSWKIEVLPALCPPGGG